MKKLWANSTKFDMLKTKLQNNCYFVVANAIKATIQILYDKRLFDHFDGKDED